MEDLFSNLIDIILYLFGTIFCIVVFVIIYFRLKKWLKEKRRLNRKRKYQDYKTKKMLKQSGAINRE